MLNSMHSKLPKLYGVLAILSALGLNIYEVMKVIQSNYAKIYYGSSKDITIIIKIL